ncbi:hypothetical protein O9929_01985 [Vibrio lentus]|nr:hypothetical protein [Vibrio lentus]
MALPITTSSRTGTQAIRQLGFEVGDIADQIGRQNVKLPSGNVETPGQNLDSF